MTLYDSQIESLFDRPGELRAMMNRKVAETVAEARVLAPTRTHALQRSIGAQYLGAGRWKVSATAPHAKFVHEGTRAHVIRVRPGKRTLRFFWLREGRVVFPVQVRHPKTQAVPFLTMAMHRVWDRL